VVITSGGDARLVVLTDAVPTIFGVVTLSARMASTGPITATDPRRRKTDPGAGHCAVTIQIAGEVKAPNGGRSGSSARDDMDVSGGLVRMRRLGVVALWDRWTC
jgi:hypothetical protein